MVKPRLDQRKLSLDVVGVQESVGPVLLLDGKSQDSNIAGLRPGVQKFALQVVGAWRYELSSRVPMAAHDLVCRRSVLRVSQLHYRNPKPAFTVGSKPPIVGVFLDNKGVYHDRRGVVFQRQLGGYR
jgi:hypothetical protein